jgi:hypothetical protein
MALGRYLTAKNTITHSRSHDPGPEVVPAYHPSLKGKTIAQIKAMLRKLDDPVVVPSKILIKPLKKLATEKLNAAGAAILQIHFLEIRADRVFSELARHKETSRGIGITTSPALACALRPY